MFTKLTIAIGNFKKNPTKHLRTILPVLLALTLLVTAVGTSFAQEDPPVELDIDTTEMTNSIFTGANIMLGALAGIMFLIAGFKFGGQISRNIVDAITNFRI